MLMKQFFNAYKTKVLLISVMTLVLSGFVIFSYVGSVTAFLPADKAVMYAANNSINSVLPLASNIKVSIKFKKMNDHDLNFVNMLLDDAEMIGEIVYFKDLKEADAKFSVYSNSFGQELVSVNSLIRQDSIYFREDSVFKRSFYQNIEEGKLINEEMFDALIKNISYQGIERVEINGSNTRLRKYMTNFSIENIRYNLKIFLSNEDKVRYLIVKADDGDAIEIELEASLENKKIAKKDYDTSDAEMFDINKLQDYFNM